MTNHQADQNRAAAAPARNTEPGAYTFLEVIVPAVRDPYAEHVARVKAQTAEYRAQWAGAERMVRI